MQFTLIMRMDQHLEMAMIFTLLTMLMLLQLPILCLVPHTNHPPVIHITHPKQRRYWQAVTTLVQPMLKFTFLSTVSSSFADPRIY